MDPTVFNILPTVFGTVFKRFTMVFNSFPVLLTHARCACALGQRTERTWQERARTGAHAARLRTNACAGVRAPRAQRSLCFRRSLVLSSWSGICSALPPLH